MTDVTTPFGISGNNKDLTKPSTISPLFVYINFQDVSDHPHATYAHKAQTDSHVDKTAHSPITYHRANSSSFSLTNAWWAYTDCTPQRIAIDHSVHHDMYWNIQCQFRIRISDHEHADSDDWDI